MSIQEDANKLLFLSKDSLEIKKEYELFDFLYAMHFYSDKIVLSDLKEKHLELRANSIEIIEHNCICYPINEVVSYCPSTKSYLMQTIEGTQLKLKRDFKLESKVVGVNLIECVLHELDNGLIKCTDLNSGEEKWRKILNGKIVRIESYNDSVIIDCYDKLGFTIALDIETGKVVWKHLFSYSKIDYDNGVILSGKDRNILEVEVSTGRIKNDLTVNVPIHLGYNPHFTDDDGIYYLTHDHSFGKVRKADGTILWEFDLIDEKGEKRKLSDWLLLGNGNLVLQAIPNHPNGDLTCVFNPKENLQYSKVKDGRRISSDYA